MAKTRPGADRLMKQSLHAAISIGERVLAGHCKQCETCIKAGLNPLMRCDFWWRLARKIHSARRTLKPYATEETGDTPPLPGM